MATKQTTIDDVFRSINRLIGTANALMERNARLAEEYESSRLATEEIRELIKELIEESGRHADRLDKSLRELQRYVILVRATGGNQETIQIEGKFARTQIENALREELATQQELIQQYQKNADKVKLKIAKFGDTVALLNELDDYQNQVDRATEAIARIRQSLAA